MTRILLGLAEFAFSIVLVVVGLFASYRIFGRTIIGLDADEELRKRNVAASIALTAVMAAPAMIILQTLGPVVFVVRTYVLRGGGEMSLGATATYAVGWVGVVFLLSMVTIRLAVGLFDRMTPDIDERKEIREGNVAVAITLSAVILIVAFFMIQGISALSASLAPEPGLGSLKVMH